MNRCAMNVAVFAGVILSCWWCVSCAGPMAADVPCEEGIQRVFILDSGWFLVCTWSDEEIDQWGTPNDEKEAIESYERHFEGSSWQIIDVLPEYCRFHQIVRKSPIHVFQAGGTEEDGKRFCDIAEAAGMWIASYHRLTPKNPSERSFLEHLPPRPQGGIGR